SHSRYQSVNEPATRRTLPSELRASLAGAAAGMAVKVTQFFPGTALGRTPCGLRPADPAGRSGRLAWHTRCCCPGREDKVMKCRDIMNTNVESLREKDTIQKAAQVMAETGAGFLPICDGKRRVVGVVTDRDLTVRVLAKKV